MKIIILQGLPGSGKSYFTKKLVADGYHIVSADHYFERGGSYEFDPSKLSEAHGECFRKAVEHAQAGRPVVVDNTSLTTEEIAPYVALAQAFGYEHEIVRIEVDPAVSFARQTHGVSEGAYRRMVDRLRRFKPLPWWNFTKVRAG